MKKKLFIIVAGVMTAMAVIAATVQTLNVRLGEVIYQYATDQVGRMALSSNGTVATILNKVFNLNEVDEMYLDETPVTDNMVYVTYSGTTAQVRVAGNIAQYVDVVANGAHVAITQSETFPGDDLGEITYVLSGTSTNGSFWMDGAYKMTLELDGVSLTNPDSAAINIRDGKRIAVTLVDGTTNTLTDGANGSQKGCFAVKGHAEFAGGGSLTITGNTSHAFWGKEYVQFKKKLTGSITVNKAVGDGFNVNQYIEMNGGTITISGVGDDGMQLSQSTDDAGVVEEDVDNTGVFTMNGGTLNITTTAAGAKGIKAAVDYVMTGGTVTINQTGGYTYDGTDASYCAGIKTDGNINITGGTVNITSTADGGRGLNCDGTINIDQSSATTNIDIKANGAGGVLEQNAEPGSGSGSTETPKSYVLYVAKPASSGYGGSNAWANSKIYLYKSDGTLVQQLTETVTRSSGYSTLTFYKYNFGAAASGTYYIKGDNYTSGGGWGGTTYTIQTVTFSGPTSGEDIYYQISSSYSTSGTTRTYSMSNVTSTYGGSSESSEDSGASYNASGLKCDGNLTIGGGTVTIANSGAMSKSIKTKATATVNGGTITLTPSGAMKVISNDASYSTGVKAVNFVMNDGSLTINASGTAGKGISTTSITTNGGTINITNTGAPQASSAGDYYTAKGMKTDGNMALNGGNITIKMTGNGGKGIKVNGNYTQGTSVTSGATLSVTTTGSAAGGSSSGGGFGPGGGSSVSGSAKAIKVMGTIVINGGQTEVSTASNGAEGIESKTSITINGGNHYYKAYDDGMNCAGPIKFAGGLTIVYSFGNDAVDSNYGRTGAIEIGNGAVFAYTTKGSPEEGLDCDNNSYITITGTGYAVSAGAAQGGGGGGWGGSSGIGSATQAYYLSTSSLSYQTGRYYSILPSSSSTSPMFTYYFESGCSSSLSLFTAKGMTSGTTYYVKSSTSAPTGTTNSFHGVSIGGTTSGSLTQLTSFTATK
ncbi:MAG: carbohydrate-binding domain-containing protein [Muribaculaceae bacterium]|nr:carbohydrate-binding domain-containing protein [Muribaculaceae bacterium]